MTDNEIIEAFENNCNSCENCPYHIYSDCDDRNRKDILNIVKRQQEEIERLNSLCTSKEIGADDMGRYDHYTDTFIKERGKR